MPAVGHLQAEPAPAVADNPSFPIHAETSSNIRRITVTVNLKESAISSLAARGVLEAHQAAACRFEKLWVVFVGSSLRSPKFEPSSLRPFSRDGLSQQQAAASELRAVRALVGIRCFSLLVRVCDEGRALRELGLGNSRRVLASLADALRWTLDDLALRWGFLSTNAEQKTQKGGRESRL